MRKVFAFFLGFMVAGSLILSVPALANHKFPGCHGKNSTDCRPDPQPSHGKDCQKHGKGGVNEDHCKVSPSPTPTPTPSPSVQPSSTPSSSPPGVPGTQTSGGTKGGKRVGSGPQLAKTGASTTILEFLVGCGIGYIGMGLYLRSRGK